MSLRFTWCALLTGLTVLFACGPVLASDADPRCDELFTALRDGNFSAATSHFGPQMKAALPPEKLAAVWGQLTRDSGKLLRWEIVRRVSSAGIDQRTVDLFFEKDRKLRASVAVTAQSGEIEGLFFKPVMDAPVESPPYANPSAFHSEDATVGPPPTALKGILTIPVGRGPFPAAVLVAGSGPQDRDESEGANRPFKDLAEGLSSRGIEVLRYDKRTFTYPHMDIRHVTVDQEVIADAVAAVDLLRHRPEVDRGRVFIIGHSLGAVLAPEIAEKAAPMRGIVLMAPTARPLPQVIVDQMRYLNQGSPEQLAQVEQQANLLMAGKLDPDSLFLGAGVYYYTDLDARDEIAVARQLHCPILILHGERDYQVIDADIRKWQQGLGHVADVKIESFASLNHLFISGSGKPGPAEYLARGHVDSEVIDAIAVFISSASVPAAAGRTSR